MSNLGDVHEQRSIKGWQSSNQRSYICRNLQQLCRADQLEGYGAFVPYSNFYNLELIIPQTFVVLILTICLAVNNIAFGLFRAKASHPPPAPQYYHPPTPHAPEYNWMPQTPRHPSAGHDMYGNGIEMTAPLPSIMPSQTPGHRSPRKGSWQ